MTANKRPVTANALIKRINRKLAPELEAVRTCKENSGVFGDLGYYYHLDLNRNVILNTHIDLEGYARELGVMHETEVLA